MKLPIDVCPEHLKIVQTILERYLPPQTTVWVFGSRAKFTAKKFSDLDLAIDAGSPLPGSVVTDISFDLEGSDLPYKVDIVDWATISDSFRERINPDKIVIWTNKVSSGSV